MMLLVNRTKEKKEHFVYVRTHLGFILYALSLSISFSVALLNFISSLF